MKWLLPFILFAGIISGTICPPPESIVPPFADRIGFRDFAIFANNWNGESSCPPVYRFDHWEGDMNGVNDPCSAIITILMDSDKTVRAVFVIDEGRMVCYSLRDLAESWLQYK